MNKFTESPCKMAKKLATGAMMAFVFITSEPVYAGGILTNTNQSIDFLRNPARDAAIGLDGVYSNPAGVVFMPEGLHIGFHWQYAHQSRTIISENPVFALGKKNSGPEKTFEGVANAPFIPSIQVAYNMEHWSLQANLSVPGGGGACEFSEGLGSFESKVGEIAQMLGAFGVTGYDMKGYMEGRQYYYGIQIGAACKVIPNLSLYGGLRMLYGSATYKAKISNMMVNTANGYVDFGSYLQNITPIAQQMGYGEAIAPLQKYSDGVNLLCNQTGIGFAPIIGVDYKLGRFNFAAKYEFRTQMRMKNESTVNDASEIEAVNKFRDGEKVNEDAPALLAIGAQWSPIDQVRINVGYHHFFDKDAEWYNHSQEKLRHGTNEFLFGAEWDTTDRLTFSAGGQVTRYGLTDDYMNDMSFVVNSYSIGFGFNYKVSKVVSVKAAYFQTYYGNYKRVNAVNPDIKDTFTRTNRVFGVGCELAL